MTVKKRITLFVAGTGLITSLLFSVVVFLELIEQPFEVMDSDLEEEAVRALRMNIPNRTGTESGPMIHRKNETGSYWITIREQGSDRVLFRSQMAERIMLPTLEPGSGDTTIAVLPPESIDPGWSRHRKVTFRVRSFKVPFDGKNFDVQIGRSMEKLNEEIWELVFTLAAGLLFSSLALIVISHLVAGRILKPIGAMKDLTRKITEKNLDQRIPVGPGQDEFNDLAITINRMLDRLQYSFIRQRNFLFDTSHELKTPLTTMRLAIDEIYPSHIPSQPHDSCQSLLRIQEQVLRMERLVKDMLNLSALEILDTVTPEPVHLSGIMTFLADDYRFLATAQNIHMDAHFPDDIIIAGDKEKLTRTFSNILDNAVRYNVDGGRIDVACIQSDDRVTITVSNSGPGVAESEIDKVFHQFYRQEKSRSLQTGGSGLGLTIAKRIIELHGGSIKMESEQGIWTRVTVQLPIKQGLFRSVEIPRYRLPEK